MKSHPISGYGIAILVAGRNNNIAYQRISNTF